MSPKMQGIAIGLLAAAAGAGVFFYSARAAAATRSRDREREQLRAATPEPAPLPPPTPIFESAPTVAPVTGDAGSLTLPFPLTGARPPEYVLVEHGDRIEAFVIDLIDARQRMSRPPTTLRVISWFRTVAGNEAADVGGAALSQHLIALAIDVFGNPDELDDLMDASRAVGLVPVPDPAKNTLHIQSERAGLLARLGVDPEELRALQA